MNILPIEKGTKKPAVKTWKQWQHRIQSWPEIEALDWSSGGIAAINGIGGWHSIDIDHASSPVILEVLLDLLGLPKDYQWVVQSTRGYHLWFRCEEPVHLGEQQKGCFVGSPLPGMKLGFKQLELRWQENYTILPPSVHPSGGIYRWRKGATPDGDTQGCILSSQGVEQALTQVASFQQEQVYPFPTTATTRRSPRQKLPDRSPWAQKVFEDETNSLRSTPTGRRNIQLNHAAYKLGQLVGSHCLSEREVAQELTQIALSIGLGREETRLTLRTALAKGKSVPRYPKP